MDAYLTGRKLPRRLPSQELDADDGQARQDDDHQDLPEVVDPGYERQPQQEEHRDDRVHGDRMVAQVRRQEAPDRDLVAAGTGQQAAANERDADREHEQRPLAKAGGEEAATESTPLPIRRRSSKTKRVARTIAPPAAINASRRQPLAR